LERLLAADNLPYERFVVEAGWFTAQIELINTLKQKGQELVLNTNIAELSAIAKFAGHAAVQDLHILHKPIVTDEVGGSAAHKTSASTTRSPRFPEAIGNRQANKDRH
jgi:hypothetical protein